MNLVKAHAFGNDFLLIAESEVPEGDVSALARLVCDRHRGVGADGLILFALKDQAASMRLLNADGSASEISGNGLRCLAAWAAYLGAGPDITIETDAGPKRLQLLERQERRYTFRAAMGHPEDLAQETLIVSDRLIEVVTLRVGNPQCVVLGDVTVDRLHTLAAALAVHPHFPAGTNVELAAVEDAGHVRILIWERGVGPTEASGTGACAAAVAAIRYGGAARDLQVMSPGGTQRVEWLDEGLFLTGWAELTATIGWIGDSSRS